MRILHVITGMRKAAGTTVFVENVMVGLRERGHDVEVCMKFDELVRGERPDIVHIHGLWSELLHKASRWARRNGIPVAWSTHGMSAPWSMRHKWWKKLIPWYLYQRLDLKHAAAIHCTTELEAEWNRKLGFVNCFVSPLGAVLPKGSPSRILAWQSDCLKVLFVGRIYPVKGLVNLIKAAALLPREAVRFRIVGPDQAGHKAELVRVAESLGVQEMFDWVGPKYGDDLEKEYASCDLLVLPSFTENFGGVVIDALAHGKPVIASKFTPWKVLEDERCGWWIGNDPKSLAETFKAVITGSNLQKMGKRGRKLVEERYTWAAVCDQIVEAYESVVHRGRT